MQCRSCGTEIAERAIVCFRCGTSTTDPVRKPAVVRRRRSPLFSFLVIALLVLMALYMGQASRTAADPHWLQLVAAACVVVALVLLIVRILRRR